MDSNNTNSGRFVVVVVFFLLLSIDVWSSVFGNVAQLLKRRTGTLLTQVRFPSAARDFSPKVNFQCRLSYGVRTPPCAIACINTCAHVKDPVVHVRVRWIMETLKHLNMHRSLGGATLSQLAFPGESKPSFPWEKSHVDDTVAKNKVNGKVCGLVCRPMHVTLIRP